MNIDSKPYKKAWMLRSVSIQALLLRPDGYWGFWLLNRWYAVLTLLAGAAST